MTDILTRLRGSPNDTLHQDAAEEIERLRAEIKHLRSVGANSAVMAAIEQLHADIEAARRCV